MYRPEISPSSGLNLHDNDRWNPARDSILAWDKDLSKNSIIFNLSFLHQRLLANKAFDPSWVFFNRVSLFILSCASTHWALIKRTGSWLPQK